ncbi:polynucleotide adenylyltransferase PcnB [Chlamydiifrater phoenicopteri]|uniref:polynucleotide adenylyltransferase PcnB n=1 Tax=Chlamydiifrater phoenicopteri TaxID=2681469 RepID=UPI0031B86E8E
MSRGLELSKQHTGFPLIPVIYSQEVHGIQLEDLSAHALSVVKTLRKAGYTAYLVGGCIRDLLLKETPKDFDVSTSAKPEEVKVIFKNCILVGKRFRLAHIRFSNQIIEVSTFRAGNPDEDSLITKDNLWGTPEEDVLRRDFTINGLFFDPFEKVIIDYTGGFEDIKNKFLQTIGDPAVRFKQDPVRMLRLLKILARHPFSVDKETSSALTTHRYELMKSSQTRVFEELLKMLGSGYAESFFRLLKEWGMLAVLFPYIDKAFNLSSIIQEQTFSLLRTVDHLVKNENIQFERHLLLAAFLFPLVNFNVHYVYQKHNGINLNETFEFIRKFLEKLFANSFTSCSKKNFILTTLLIQLQYRLTPLKISKKRNFFNKKLLQHSRFPEALLLLKLRSSTDPKWMSAYQAWFSHWNPEKTE